MAILPTYPTLTAAYKNNQIPLVHLFRIAPILQLQSNIWQGPIDPFTAMTTLLSYPIFIYKMGTSRSLDWVDGTFSGIKHSAAYLDYLLYISYRENWYFLDWVFVMIIDWMTCNIATTSNWSRIICHISMIVFLHAIMMLMTKAPFEISGAHHMCGSVTNVMKNKRKMS